MGSGRDAHAGGEGAAASFLLLHGPVIRSVVEGRRAAGGQNSRCSVMEVYL